ncbi:ADP-ribosylglycohydrolase family protein [Actinokineospora auranticolor]|uniref:ADP-ribosylglycohydrolase n=1 Tax=Actinokineospora auranticolor TaxID=155976 RepID=A0A2S6GFD4_9PSEU|nr:ADP-ribosylglycohydrolase family protein [Actinokineospora auranticolor]PPK63856.1 ADP-ribosylglycohydrolase [Actinokineospora auranticolor]
MNRAAASFYGPAFGDAPAKPTEFLSVAKIDDRYGPVGPDELDGDPAVVTDDTQMALAVAWALRNGELTPAEVEPRLRKRFVAWAHSPDNNRAPGMTCSPEIVQSGPIYRRWPMRWKTRLMAR